MDFLFKKRQTRSNLGNIALLIFLLICGFFMVLPLIYTISTALKPFKELWLFPPRFFVKDPTLKNFRDLFTLMSNSWIPFSRYLINSLSIMVLGTAGHIILASMCAYAISKYIFPGSKLFFKLVVTSLMFTGAVTAIPNFIVISKLNLMDTFLAIVIPAFGAPLGLFLMKQFMDQQVPQPLLEAASIDGASQFIIFWKIVMPIVKSGWLTLMVFSAQGLWSVGASPFIYSEAKKTLPFALSQIASSGLARAGVGGAVSVVMLLVPVMVFLFTQSNIIETMATSGMKD